MRNWQGKMKISVQKTKIISCSVGHLQYLKEHKQFVYLNPLTSGKLNEYLESVSE